jgi:hypothetical protein
MALTVVYEGRVYFVCGLVILDRRTLMAKRCMNHIVQKRRERFGKGNMDGASLRDIYSARRYLFGTWNLGRCMVLHNPFLISWYGMYSDTYLHVEGLGPIRYRSVRALDESLFEINHPAGKKFPPRPP